MEAANDIQDEGKHAEEVVPTPSLEKVDELPNHENAVSNTLCGSQTRTFIVLLSLLVLACVVVIGVEVPLSRPDDPSDQPLSNPTASPTVAPTQPLEAVLEPWVIRTNEDRALFEDPSSPQSLALNWLSSDTFLRTSPGRHEPREILERYVLAVLYFSAGGPSWPRRQFYNFFAWSTCLHLEQ